MILSRAFEKIIVKKFICPAVTDPPAALTFKDQFSFRPNASTTAALISTLQITTKLLETNDYVHLITLDFSKAFDSVRHSSLLLKMSYLNLPDYVYNWIVHFFQNHSQRTIYNIELSETLAINASVIQGSAVGPAAFLAFASDLQAV